MQICKTLKIFSFHDITFMLRLPFFSHADLNDFERGGALGRKKRRQVTAEQVNLGNLEFYT